MNSSLTNATTSNAIIYDRSVPFTHPAYIIKGVLMLLTNSLIVGAVAKYKLLNERKVCWDIIQITFIFYFQEYIIIAALALADALSGVGFIGAGIWRTSIVLSGYRYNEVCNGNSYLLLTLNIMCTHLKFIPMAMHV
jgi:hypothetical protein